MGERLQGGRDSVTLVDFKSRYSASWQNSSLREKIAECLIRLVLPGELCVTGIGAESAERVDEWGSPPDFFHQSLGRWFEVTGTDLTKPQSAAVCAKKFHRPEPCLFVREGKVEAAKMNRVASKLVFVSVNEMDGSVLFFPCQSIFKGSYDLVEGFERDGERYYAIPWRKWLTPYQLAEWLFKKASGGDWRE